MRQQRKPYVVTVRGKLCYRLQWRENGKTRNRYLPLPGKEDSPEFDAAYWEIRGGTAPVLKESPRTSWAALVASYRSTRRYKTLAPGTRRKYDPVIEALLEKNGAKDVRKVTRAQVRAIHEKHQDTPRKADHYVQVIRILLGYAKTELDWIKDNPAEGIKLFGSQKGWEPWPEWLQRAWLGAADPVALTAFHLGTGTGQRPGDLAGMMWEHFDGEYMAVQQDKTKERLWVFCPAPLRAYLATLPRYGRYILAKNLTEPLGYDAIEKAFRRVRDDLGEKARPYVMHGWRFTAAVRLAEAGCSDAEIQAVTGHKTLEMVQRYRGRASQKKLSKSAQEKANER